MNDDTGATAVFDIPLNSATQGGGFITNEWVHIAIESNMDLSNSTLSTVAAYIDGKRVSGTLLGVPTDALTSNQAVSTVNASYSQVDIAHMGLSTFSIDTAENISPGSGINFESCVEWDSPASMRDFDQEMVRDRHLMTVQMCATLCQESAVYATHFAVGRHQACFCGSEMSRATQMDDRYCSAGCAGDGTVKCGGHLSGPGDYYSIYSFGATRADKLWESLPTPLNAARAIYLGGHAWTDARGQSSGGFMGNVADLAIFDRALGDKDIDCLYRETQRGLGSCDPQNLRTTLSAYLGQAEGTPSGAAAGDQVAAPDGRQDGQVRLFPDPWLDVTRPDDDVPSGAHKVGQSLVVCTSLSSIDPTRCATLDEIARGATVAAPTPAGATVDAVPNFAADGTFGLSLWFQRGWCSVANAQDTTLLRWAPSSSGGVASVDFQLVCAGSVRAPSTLAGHVLRIEVVDDAGTAFSADVSVDSELDNGLVVDEWANLIVGVQPSSVGIVVDSNAVLFSDFRGNVTGLMGFDQRLQSSRVNVAYPDPGADFPRALSTFATLSGAITVGGAPTALTSDQWVGEMQMLQGFGRPLSADDVRCLYRTQLARRG